MLNSNSLDRSDSGNPGHSVQQIQHQITIAADEFESYIPFTKTLNWFNKI